MSLALTNGNITAHIYRKFHIALEPVAFFGNFHYNGGLMEQSQSHFYDLMYWMILSFNYVYNTNVKPRRQIVQGKSYLPFSWLFYPIFHHNSINIKIAKNKHFIKFPLVAQEQFSWFSLNFEVKPSTSNAINGLYIGP